MPKHLWMSCTPTKRGAEIEELKASACALQDRLRSKPLFPSQQQEKRVIKLRPGQPALMALPVPNPDDDNSAVMVGFQVGRSSKNSPVFCLLLSCMVSRFCCITVAHDQGNLFCSGPCVGFYTWICCGLGGIARMRCTIHI